MEKTKKMAIGGLLVFGILLWLLPLTGETATITVTCPTDSRFYSVA